MNKILVLLALIAVLFAPAPAVADYLDAIAQSKPTLFKFETDVLNKLNADRCVGISSTTPIMPTSGYATLTVGGTCSVVLSGTPYAISGSTTVSLVSLAASAQTTGTWRNYVVQVNPLYAVDATGSSATSPVYGKSAYTVVAGAAATTRAAATWPALTAGNVAVGYMVLKANGTFTPGTSTFDAQTAYFFGPIIGPYAQLVTPVSLNPVNE